MIEACLDWIHDLIEFSALNFKLAFVLFKLDNSASISLDYLIYVCRSIVLESISVSLFASSGDVLVICVGE